MAHHHHHEISSVKDGDWRLWAAVAINLLLTLAQIIGGVLSGSLALIADAVHNLSDAFSLIIALAARKIARRPADKLMSFGYGRAEVVAALINYTSLILIAVYLVFEALWRFVVPHGVNGGMMVYIAIIALIINSATALLTLTMSKTSMNIRAAFLHNLSDALGSLAVIVAGLLIMFFDWHFVDPLVTAMIAGYILWQSWAEIGGVIRVLMLGTPPGIDAETVIGEVEAMEGVSGFHNVHVWQVQEHLTGIDGHLVIEDKRWDEADRIKTETKTLLRQRFGIAHAVLELENSAHACHDAAEIGDENAEIAPHAPDHGHHHA